MTVVGDFEYRNTMSSRSDSVSVEAAKHSNQTPKHPPATPVYVLRGHASPIHALEFFSKNSRLISGDADGWVLVWSTSTKRPVAAWKAHHGAILGVQGVDSIASGLSSAETRIFTHGRDHALRVWRLNEKDEEILDKALPVDEEASSQQINEPWLIHSLAVNALNFCPFALCFVPPGRSKDQTWDPTVAYDLDSERLPPSEMFLGAPNALNTGGIDIFHLPSEKRVSTISPNPSINTGMVMALNLFLSAHGELYAVSAYEDGRAMVHVRRGPIQDANQKANHTAWDWEALYVNQAHSQPVLSLDVSPVKRDCFLTSSADALIVKHPIPVPPQKSGGPPSPELLPMKVVNTKHAGQQGLKIRSDEKIFVTAGWDSRNRVYSCKSMKELAVLKWHKEGCYAIALADVNLNFDEDTTADVSADTTRTQPDPPEGLGESGALAVNLQGRSLAAIKLQRSQKAQLTHWIAAGSKDGKISLWDIY